MSLLRPNRLLLCLVTLLFALGYGHQVFGKYVPHHHSAEHATTSDAGDDDDDDQPANGPRHFAGHHHAVAVFSDFTVLPVGKLFAVGKMIVIPEAAPDAVPPRIDVPPQLA